MLQLNAEVTYLFHKATERSFVLVSNYRSRLAETTALFLLCVYCELDCNTPTSPGTLGMPYDYRQSVFREDTHALICV